MTTLGICIPTYRRPEFLRRCILSAIASAEGRPVRLFVADDAVDGTNDALLAELRATDPTIQVRRNAANLGIDDNIQLAVDLCDCDYAWLVGEDDAFLPGAVAAMHDALPAMACPFVLANYAYVGEDPAHRIATALPESGAATLEAGSFLAEHLWAAGFIGACVVRKQEWSKTQALPYKGTYFTHVGRIAEIVSDAGTAAVVRRACVANRVEGTDTFTWKRDTYGVFFGFLAMCRTVAERRPARRDAMAAAAKTMEHRYRWLSIRLAMRLRSERGYDHAQYVKYLRHGPVGAMRRLAFFMISVSPPALFRPLVVAYRALRTRT